MARPSAQPKTLASLSGDDNDTSPGTDDVEAFLTDIGADGALLVKIERKQEEGPSVGKWGFCAKRQASGNMMEDVQRDFGPGTYQLTMTDAATGQYRRKAIILVHAPAGYGPGGAAAAAVPVADPRLDSMQRLFETLLTALIAKPAAPVVSPLDDLSKILSVVGKLIPQDGGGETRALDMYLRGRSEGEQSAKALMSLQSVGDGDGEALLKIGMPLVEMAQKQMEMNRQNPAPVQPPVAVQPIDGADTVIPWWVAALRRYIPDLYARAQAGKTPSVYAAMVVEDMPDAALDRVKSLLNEPDFGARFLSAFPQFGESIETQKWIGDFFSAILDEIEDVQQLNEDLAHAPVDDSARAANE
jgi:hypothetical protein